MSQHRLIFGLIPLALAVCGEQALAHYLRVVRGDTQEGEHVANIFFEESPAAGDGQYLNHFLGSSDVWIRTLEDPTAAPMKASNASA